MKPSAMLDKAAAWGFLLVDLLKLSQDNLEIGKFIIKYINLLLTFFMFSV